MRLSIALLLLAAAPGFAAPPLTTNHGAAAQVGHALPLFFIPNAGQMSPEVRFAIQTPELQAGFGADFAVFQSHETRFTVRFGGARGKGQVVGEELMPGRANFLIGDQPGAWRTDLRTYGRIRYRELYPGIDVIYSGAGARVKSEFRVAPGADPHQIRLEYGGGVGLTINAEGDLIATSGEEHLRERAPVVYQQAADGTRSPVEARYRLLGEHAVGFEIGAYDVGRELVIDPVISYSTFLGGSASGAVTAVTFDGSGNLYAAGWTAALNFPIVGAEQAVNKGSVNAFVVKLNPLPCR